MYGSLSAEPASNLPVVPQRAPPAIVTGTSLATNWAVPPIVPPVNSIDDPAGNVDVQWAPNGQPCHNTTVGDVVTICETVLVKCNSFMLGRVVVVTVGQIVQLVQVNSVILPSISKVKNFSARIVIVE